MSVFYAYGFGPRWGSLQRSPDPLAALGGGEGDKEGGKLGKEGTKGGGREKEEREGEEGRGREEREWERN